jgi:hypothetical protein
MTATPGLFKILDLTVAALRATTGYGNPITGSGIPVFDGPIVGMDAPATYVAIGWNPSGDSGTLRTAAAHMGARADLLEEGEFDVTCVAVTGANDAATPRATVRQLIADVTAAVYGLSDASFAGYWAEVGGLDLRQDMSQAGTTVEAAVKISYRLQMN